MALVFPEIMTAYLGQAVITGYFKEIVRARVDVVTWTKRFPLLSAFVVNNAETGDRGDGLPISTANYVFVAAAKMPAGKDQDKLIAEMVDKLSVAAESLAYSKINGHSGKVHLGPWESDDNFGEQPGDRVWVEVPSRVEFMQDQ